MHRCTPLRAALLAVFLAGAAVAESGAAPPPNAQTPKIVSLAERLAKPIEFKFSATPLRKVAEELQSKLTAPVVIQAKVLEEAGISLDFPLAGEAQNGSALDAINELLKPAALGAEIRHGILTISTLEAQSAWVVANFYRLKPGSKVDDVFDEVTTKIEPESWDSVGGPGSIREIGPSVVVILQTAPQQRKIASQFAKSLTPVSVIPEAAGVLVKTQGTDPLKDLRARLRSVATAQYPETPLKDLASHFEARNRIGMDLDRKSLIAARVSESTPVTVNLRNVPLESLLTHLTEPMGLTWTVAGERILLTTPQGAEERLLPVRYDVADLTPALEGKELRQILIRTIDPASWSDVGGPGNAEFSDGNLSVSQSVQVHRAIELWLANLRAALKPEPAEK